MPTDDQRIDQRPVQPPTAASTFAPTQWMVLLAALLVLVIGAWRAFVWVEHNVAERRVHAQQMVSKTINEENQLTSDLGETGKLKSIDQKGKSAHKSSTHEDTEPLAPAVTGRAVNRCVLGDEVVFTNRDCPSGFFLDRGQTTPSADRRHLFARQDDVAQKMAICQWLGAEIERLGYEFNQTLPPPVLDRISTELAGLKQAAKDGGCP